MSRVPTAFSSIQHMLNNGVCVNTVLDVGAAINTDCLQRALPDKKHILFEPMVEFSDACKKDYESKKIDYELHTIALGDTIDPAGEIFYLKRDNVEFIWCGVVPKGVDKYHGHTHPTRAMEITTLDSFLSDKEYKKPYYLKVDVDGREMNILTGAKNILKDCSVIQVEAVLRNDAVEDGVGDTRDWRTAGVWGNLPQIKEYGFRLWDIVDLMYVDDDLWQVDLMFLNSKDYNRIKKEAISKKIEDRIYSFTES